MFYLHSHRKKTIKTTTQLAIVRLIYAIGLSIIDTIWSLYMNSFGLKDATIGFISAIFVVLTLLFSFFSTIILEKWDESSIFITSMIILIISYLIIFNNILSYYLFL